MLPWRHQLSADAAGVCGADDMVATSMRLIGRTLAPRTAEPPLSHRRADPRRSATVLNPCCRQGDTGEPLLSRQRAVPRQR